MGFGFQLHLIIGDCGDLLGVHFTPGNVDERGMVTPRAKSHFGKLFGDSCYF